MGSAGSIIALAGACRRFDEPPLVERGGRATGDALHRARHRHAHGWSWADSRAAVGRITSAASRTVRRASAGRCSSSSSRPARSASARGARGLRLRALVARPALGHVAGPADRRPAAGAPERSPHPRSAAGATARPASRSRDCARVVVLGPEPARARGRRSPSRPRAATLPGPARRDRGPHRCATARPARPTRCSAQASSERAVDLGRVALDRYAMRRDWPCGADRRTTPGSLPRARAASPGCSSACTTPRSRRR